MRRCLCQGSPVARCAAGIVIVSLIAACTRSPAAATAEPSASEPSPSPQPTVTATAGEELVPTVSWHVTLPGDPEGVDAVARAGSTVLRRLPSGEQVRDVRGNDALTVSGVEPTTIRVRAVDGLDELWSHQWDGRVGDAALVDGAAFITGLDDRREDIGLVSMAVPEGGTTQLVPPQPEFDWSSSARIVLAVSSRQRVGTLVCISELDCEFQLVDVESGDPRIIGLPDQTIPIGLGSDFILSRSPEALVSIDAATGEVRWSMPIAFLNEAYVDDVTDTIVAYVTAAGSNTSDLITIDADTGDRRPVAEWPLDRELTLFPEISTADVAVLGPSGALRDAIAEHDASVPIVTVDLNTGSEREEVLDVTIE